MPSAFDIILIIVFAATCILFPAFDRFSIRKLIKEQTGHDLQVPKNRLIYRTVQTFGLGFPVGGFLLPLAVEKLSALEAGFLGGAVGILVSVIIKVIRKDKKDKNKKADTPKD